MKEMSRTYCIGCLMALLLVLGLVINGSAQESETNEASRGTIIDLGGQAWDIKKTTFSLKEIKYRSKLVGSRYLFDEWLPADIYLSGDTVEVQDVLIRIDLQMHTLEVKFQGEARAFPYYLVDHFRMKQTNEVYYTQIGLDNAYIPMGFYKELYRENSGLYCLYSTMIKESYYNPAIDAGRKDDQLLKVSTYYALVDGDMVRLERSKAKRMRQLGDPQVVEQYVKDKKIDIRSEKGMISVLNYIDKGNQ